MLSLLNLRKLIVPLLVVLAVAMAGFAVYKAGGANERADQLEEQLERIESITDAINEGREEIRRENPTGSPDIALERLKNRQDRR